ncbi:hypothetical protein [Streptomyces sp. NPDC059893]|uniref:hypothetical protein n=1 Tax=Streptomyces sp. NPDC059893 TaxID=3346990 RepID=UPI003650B504
MPATCVPAVPEGVQQACERLDSEPVTTAAAASVPACVRAEESTVTPADAEASAGPSAAADQAPAASRVPGYASESLVDQIYARVCDAPAWSQGGIEAVQTALIPWDRGHWATAPHHVSGLRHASQSAHPSQLRE